MQRIIYILIVLLYLPHHSAADTYPEVIFDNSLVVGSYAKSSVTYSGGSWVENVNNKLLVSDTLFFTPGNALSLKYLSAKEGSWAATVNYSRQKNHYRFNTNDQLSFFIYINTKDTKIEDLPKIFIIQRNGLVDTLALDKFIPSYATKRWLQVKIPCKEFLGIDNEIGISGVGFVQHESSPKEHHLFIDQIEFLPSKYAEVKLNTPAILTEAIPYDKMVHLKWQLPLSPSIRYVKLYRSKDGKNFEPVGIRPVPMQSCLDVVPKAGDKYYYKIVWLDYNYKESPPSEVKVAETKVLNSTAILNLIQGAHINFFVENFDVNSGMYMPNRIKDKAIVSTKETAGAILSLIVGAENKQVSRKLVFQRISKIVYFLMKVQNRDGIYPAYLDGRKGLPEYRSGMASYDVQATSSLIEALLIAREYFNSDQDEERDLRSRITSLYDQINWEAIVNAQGLLKPRFGLVDTELSNRLTIPLNGANEAINTYLLAISSSKHALPTSSYFEGVYNNFGMRRVAQIEELEADVYSDSLSNDEGASMLLHRPFTDSLSRSSILKPSIKYAVDLPFGEYTGSLMELYKPFLTINPTLLKDSVVNWAETVNAYVKYVKRSDNERGVGVSASDIWGFYQHKDSIGNYRINPAIGPSALIADKNVGVAAALALYQKYGDVLFTEYGFRSWLDLRNNDVSDEYLAMNQSAIVVALENAKTGLIWELYQKIPELEAGRKKLFVKPTL